MNSHYFAQYLLNEGVLSGEEERSVLRQAVAVNPGLPVLAMCKGLVKAKQLADVADDENAAAKMLEKGLLTDSQVSNLKQSVVSESMRFAQALLNAGMMNYESLEENFKKYSMSLEHPLETAVKKIAGERLEEELAYYEEYATVFMHSLVRFMDTPAVINTEVQATNFAEEKLTYAVSQRLSGDVSLAICVVAAEEVFLKMAKRYSHEDFVEVDDLVLDSVTEFLNVLNGLYIIDLAKKELDVDLEIPKIFKNIQPSSNNQLILPVETCFGSLYVVLATDEFFNGEIIL